MKGNPAPLLFHRKTVQGQVYKSIQEQFIFDKVLSILVFMTCYSGRKRGQRAPKNS